MKGNRSNSDNLYTPPEMDRILPTPGFKPTNLHTRMLASDGGVKSLCANWCPVCHSRDGIGERTVKGRPVWHCATCGYEW